MKSQCKQSFREYCFLSLSTTLDKVHHALEKIHKLACIYGLLLVDIKVRIKDIKDLEITCGVRCTSQRGKWCIWSTKK